METLIVHTENEKLKKIKEFLQSIKVDFVIAEKTETEEDIYTSEFIETVKANREDFKNGNYKKISLDEIWK